MSTRRFVGIDRAQLLAMIDLDASLYVEYDDGAKEPVALIETARDVGQEHKPVTVTRRLAMRAGLPCYLLLDTRADTRNPADTRWRDITHFRIKRVWPRPPEATWRKVAPGEWAQALLQIRTWAACRLDVQAANGPLFQVKPPQAQLATDTIT